MGDPKESIYSNDAALQQRLVEKNKAKVADYVKEFDKIPGYIKKKDSENIKSRLTTKAYQLRESMEYVTTKVAPFYGRRQDTPDMKEADEFFQDLADLGVAARIRNWEMAQESYDKSTSSFKAWMKIVDLK